MKTKTHKLHRAMLFLILALPALSQTITTVGGNSSWGRVNNIALDSQGNLYARDDDQCVVYQIDKLGITTVVAGTLGRAG